MDKQDTQAFQSINGDLGGVWAPTSVIEIGGFGLKISAGAFLNVDSQADFADNVVFHDTVVFSGAAQFDLPILVTNTSDYYGEAEFHGPALFDDLVTLDDDATANGLFDFYDNVVFHKDVDLGTSAVDQIDCRGQLETFADVLMHEDLDVEGAFTALGDVQLGSSSSDTIDVLGEAEFHQSATFDDPVEFLDLVTFRSNVAIGDTSDDLADFIGRVRIRARLEYIDNGRVPHRAVQGPNANALYEAKNTQVIWVGNLTSSRTYTIDTSDTVDGDWLEVSAAIVDPTRSLTINEQGGGNLGTIVGNGARRVCMKFVRAGGAWRVHSKSIADQQIE